MTWATKRGVAGQIWPADRQFDTPGVCDCAVLCMRFAVNRCMRLCSVKLCAVCIYLAIKSTACPIASVTVILFKGFFELCEIC